MLLRPFLDVLARNAIRLAAVLWIPDDVHPRPVDRGGGIVVYPGRQAVRLRTEPLLDVRSHQRSPARPILAVADDRPQLLGDAVAQFGIARAPVRARGRLRVVTRRRGSGPE